MSPWRGRFWGRPWGGARLLAGHHLGGVAHFLAGWAMAACTRSPTKGAPRFLRACFMVFPAHRWPCAHQPSAQGLWAEGWPNGTVLWRYSWGHIHCSPWRTGDGSCSSWPGCEFQWAQAYHASWTLQRIQAFPYLDVAANTGIPILTPRRPSSWRAGPCQWRCDVWSYKCTTGSAERPWNTWSCWPSCGDESCPAASSGSAPPWHIDVIIRAGEEVYVSGFEQSLEGRCTHFGALVALHSQWWSVLHFIQNGLHGARRLSAALAGQRSCPGILGKYVYAAEEIPGAVVGLSVLAAVYQVALPRARHNGLPLGEAVAPPIGSVWLSSAASAFPMALLAGRLPRAIHSLQTPTRLPTCPLGDSADASQAWWWAASCSYSYSRR